MNIDRDFEQNPITPSEAITLFKEEDFDLALASRETVEEAARIAELEGFFYIEDIISRWDDLQEELRCMAQEFM